MTQLTDDNTQTLKTGLADDNMSDSNLRVRAKNNKQLNQSIISEITCNLS